MSIHLRGVFLLFFCLFQAYVSHAQFVIDTVDTENGKVLLYSNRKWEFLADKQFDGILNRHILNVVEADSTMDLKYHWDTESCYSSEARAYNYEHINDTIWLCAVDSLHKNFVMPVRNVVTSRYGWRKDRMHYGIDINLNTGDTVYAAFSGRVRYSQFNSGGYGNLVIIRHYNGLETYSAHLSELFVLPNQLVEAGQPIGLGGNTGRSFGAHLHFEVRFFDLPINPELMINFEKGELLDENLFIHKGLFTPIAQSHPSNHNADKPKPAPTAKPKAKAKYYKVRKGDTLNSIARANGTSINELCKLNKIKATSTIRIGQTIRVR
jgi:murein DD-endopeptidase MepM/ murein hydrolase activator NlpD